MQTKIHTDTQNTEAVTAARMRFFERDDIIQAYIHEHTFFPIYQYTIICSNTQGRNASLLFDKPFYLLYTD